MGTGKGKRIGTVLGNCLSASVGIQQPSRVVKLDKEVGGNQIWGRGGQPWSHGLFTSHIKYNSPKQEVTANMYQ